MTAQHLDDPQTKDTIRQLPLFATLSEDDLDTLFHMTRTVSVPAGHVLMREGGPPDAAYVIVDGELEITTNRAGKELLIAVRKNGELVGEMSLLEQAPRSATVRAARESLLLEVTQAALETLISCSKTARWAVLAGVASRLRGTQSLVEQNAKMAQLGELAADLAHEINNPAAAVRRSVEQLRAVLEARDQLVARLAGSSTSLDELRQLAAQHAAQASSLDTLARADREDELLGWLEDRDVAGAWEIADILASYGWTLSELDELIAQSSDAEPALVVQLAARSTQVNALLDEIGFGASAISERVRDVKEYAFLDQAPVQLVNVHEGLDSALRMLRPKLKAGISISREYAPDLPRIEAYGGELNEVWTNLIDNALQSMGEQGELQLRTEDLRDGSIRVEIVDTGPGIPEDVLPRIFDVGFTTKAPGEGSGRGLHIARNIVEDKHRGRIDVASEPGRTEFRVTLPVALSRRTS
jgi:signal transduction histidine kinase